MLAVDRTSASIQFLENWVVIPITSCAMLAYVWGISKLIQIMAPTSSFPASVAGMVILFALLIASMYLFGPKPTNRVVAIITPTTDFLLRWINVLFCPALINVPKTPAVSPLEVGRITAVFVAGFFIFLAAASSIIRVMRMLSPFKSKTKKEQANDEEQAHEIDERMSIAASNHTNPDDRATSTAFELEDMTTNSRSHDDNNHTTISSAMPSETTFESQADDATEASTTRPSPFISRGSSVAILEHPPEAPTASGQASDEPHHPALNSLFIRLQKSVLHLYTNLTINHKIYLVLFLTSLIAFLALPTSSPASPFFSTLVQLTCVVLAYLAALTVPLHIRFFVHPMLTCSAVTLSLIAILEATKNRSLLDGLNEFSSGRKYNVLLAGGGRGAHGEILWPGAGDVLFSFMDASIVSLGVVMFKYRAELKLHVSIGAFLCLMNIIIIIITAVSLDPL
ncbi:hypothetical protein BC936DRAFT_144784 [Jimgerdemannia flammicorona]|uniref:Uncharacterized protein n=1 Tax=Jimgerdemannia flammicorona TaxID=994334 RepID=A0A433DBQ0_9FUNG|nr:hypothetical protein BC936DRAFT_144784 [Jimgerdemannia flammicorona]